MTRASVHATLPCAVDVLRAAQANLKEGGSGSADLGRLGSVMGCVAAFVENGVLERLDTRVRGWEGGWDSRATGREDGSVQAGARERSWATLAHVRQHVVWGWLRAQSWTTT